MSVYLFNFCSVLDLEYAHTKNKKKYLEFVCGLCRSKICWILSRCIWLIWWIHYTRKFKFCCHLKLTCHLHEHLLQHKLQNMFLMEPAWILPCPLPPQRKRLWYPYFCYMPCLLFLSKHDLFRDQDAGSLVND